MDSGICQSVLFELNSCRSNPSKYSVKLANTLKYYKGKIFEKPGYPAYQTEEGPENVQSCIKYLKSVRPAQPLMWSEALAKAAQAHVDDIGPKGLTGHDSSDGSDAAARIEKFGQWAGQLGENIDYGNCEGEDILVSLLIDDGVLARGQRLNIMKREHIYTGVGFGYHSEYDYICVIIFAEVIIENPQHLPLASDQTTPSQHIKKKPKSCAFEKFDASSYTKSNLGHSDIIEIKHFFDKVDYESSGSIDSSDIMTILNTPDMTTSSLFHVLNDIKFESQSRLEFEDLLDLYSFTKEKNEEFHQKKTGNIGKKEKKSVRVEEDKNLIYEVDSEQVKSKHPNLTPADVEQIKEVFDAYDSDSAGWINLEDLVSQIRDGEYEEGLVSIIDVLISLPCKGKRKVAFQRLLDMLDAKISEKLHPKAEKKVTYESAGVKTTTYNCKGTVYTETKQVINKKDPKFDPSDYTRAGLTDEEILEIKDAFDLFDTEKSGKIDTHDLKQAMQRQGFEEKSPVIYKMVCEIDVEGKGKVDFEEFLDLMTEQDVQESTKDEIRKVFNLFDVDQTGYIELNNLKRIVKELGESLKEEEIVDLITKSDADGDGKVSFQEFYDIMSRSTF